MDTQAPRSLLAYDDLASPAQMRADSAATEARLRLDRVIRAARRPAPALDYDQIVQDLPKPRIEISEAARRLAGALSLHLD